MDKFRDVILHLHIIHTWAAYARERHIDNFFTEKHLENMEEWIMDALDLLKMKQEGR